MAWQFPLLKGTEVLLSFLGGDPDRPVITGSVPNSENPARVTMSNATQSGINTPGGHYLAMEDSASGPMMQMGAPVGNTKLTLGEGSVSGAELQTDNHMQLTSGSYTQQVSNMYFHSMDGGLGGGPSDDSGGTQSGGQTTAATVTDPAVNPVPAPDPDPDPNPNKPYDYFPDFSHTGKFQDYQIAPSATFTPSWSIKMDATLEQTAASIGVMKQGLSAMVWEISVSIAGPKSTWAISWGGSEFKSGFKNTYATRLEQVLNSKKVYMTSEDKAVNKRVETGTYIQESVALTKISCGPHSIAVTPAGIIISSPVPITFDGAVHVMGDSVVRGDLAAANLSAMEYIKAGLSVITTQLKTGAFELGMGRMGLVVPPPNLTKEGASFTAAQIAMEVKAKAVLVSSEVNQTAKKLNELAQEARDIAGIAPV